MSNMIPAIGVTHLSPRHRVWLLAILFSAFVLRMFATFSFEGLAGEPSRRAFGADAVEFNAIAANLAGQGEYAIFLKRPTSFRAPGFPIALAGVYVVFGVNNYVAAHIFLCLIGAALPLAVFLLAREGMRINTALMAAGLVAVYPNILYYAMHFSSEPLYTLLLTVSLLFLLRAVKHATAYPKCVSAVKLSGCYALSGFLLGLAALTRPLAFYFFPFYVIVALWLGRRQWPLSTKGCMCFTLTLLITIAPWTVRNYLAHQHYLLIASNGGATFWGSNNAIVLNDPAYRGGWVSSHLTPEEKIEVQALSNEVVRDKYEWECGKRFVLNHACDIPRLAWYKLISFWTPFCGTPNRKYNYIVGITYGVMIPLMGIGLWLCLRSRGWDAPEIMVLSMPVIATVLSCLVVYGSARFRSTIEPILLIFAAEALVRIGEQVCMRFPALIQFDRIFRKKP